MSPNPDPPQQRSTFFAWLARRFGGGRLNARGALTIIISTTVAVTVLGGVVIRIGDHKDFDSLGEGIWWAVQTVTTVGYGDLVPQTTFGRVIGAIVMLTGIAFISLITASVTAILVEQARQRQAGSEQSVGAQLDEISARLEAIESKLGDQPPRSGG